jgi:hypothetical protein
MAELSMDKKSSAVEKYLPGMNDEKVLRMSSPVFRFILHKAGYAGGFDEQSTG